MSSFLSTTSALPGSGSAPNNTWTSPTKNADRADKVVGSAIADQAGTLFVDQSGDNTNWDLTQSVAVTANTGASFEVDLVLAFYRLRFTNTAASAQTYLRVFSYAASAGTQG